jgi:hypothetical protein
LLFTGRAFRKVLGTGKNEHHGSEPKSKEAVESEVWNAYFRLRADSRSHPHRPRFPRNALRRLQQIGDRAKALEYLMRWPALSPMKMDVDAAPDIVNKLNAYAPTAPPSNPC